MDSNLLLSQSCRICSIEYQNGINIFGDDGKKLYLQAKIRKYLYITISVDDKLPKMICETCCRRLEGFHKFATTAVKIQDKLNKAVANSSNHGSSILEPKKVEKKGLLHTYLTKGMKEKDNIFQQQEVEVTEMEIRVDPMLVLQYAFDEDGYLSETDSQTSRGKCLEIENNSSDLPETNSKSFNCPNCARRFTSELALQGHMWCHYPKTKCVLLSNYDNLICEMSQIGEKNLEEYSIYEKVIATQSVKSNLAENGNDRLACPICGKYISTKGNLKVHLETHRPKGKYACDICGRIFKTQCNLLRHKEYHEGVQFPCVVCGRVYPTNSTLRAHSITHSDLRPHKCPLCEKTFKRNQDLKFHINQHTGARPYQCPYCPKAFASSGNCFSHRKRMHPLEVERDRERAAKIMR